MSHPSFLQLDRHAIGVTSPEIEAHLTRCPQCAAHLGRLTLPARLPDAVRDAVKPRPYWTLRRAWLLAPLAVLALLVVIVPLEDEVRSKGAPAVAVFVRHDGTVTRWDGKRPLTPGDGVRLEVVPSDFGHLTVVQAGAVLYDAAIVGPQLLPGGWELDAAPGPERIEVVLSQTPLSPDELKSLPAAGRSERLWVISLVLPKEPPR